MKKESKNPVRKGRQVPAARCSGTIVGYYVKIPAQELEGLRRRLQALRASPYLHPDEPRFREQLEELERRLGNILGRARPDEDARSRSKARPTQGWVRSPGRHIVVTDAVTWPWAR